MMIEASTMAPIAIAMPPSDMMLALSPCASIGTNASATATGSDSTGIMAVRRCHRNSTITRLTISSSSHSTCTSVCMARWISSERSYVTTSWTPGGNDPRTSASRRFTRSITRSAFSLCRMTTMPPTTSPRPSSSAMPVRGSGPSVTLPSWRSVTGVPPAPTRTGTDSRSATPWT